MFRIFCKAIGVTRILAVSHANHPLKDKNEGFTLAYDEVWRERGGIEDVDGFFSLAVTAPVKTDDEIPVKKRSQYRKRAAMYNSIGLDIANHVSNKAGIPHPSAPERHPVVEPSVLDKFLLILGYGCAIVVLALTNLLGGTVLGFVLGVAFVHTTYWLLRGNIPDQAGKGIAFVARMRRSPTTVRIALAMLVLALAVMIDLQLPTERDVGRVFKLYFVPIFLSSLCLGTRVTLIVFAASIACLNFLHLPPRYSLAISTWEEIADLLIFTSMAAIIFLVPRLLLVSLELTKAKRSETKGNFV